MTTDNRIKLKVKVDSLSAEIRIIRAKEKRLKLPELTLGQATKISKENEGKSLNEISRLMRLERRRRRAAARSAEWYPGNDALREELYLHRKALGQRARHAALALAFLNGRMYAQCEKETRKPVNVVEIAQNVERFGTVDHVRERVFAWVSLGARPDAPVEVREPLQVSDMRLEPVPG